MTAQCPSCGGHQPEGLLCWQDTEAVMTMLAAIPELVDQLDIAASKQAKISSGGKSGKGTAHLKEPVNWGAVAARDALLVEFALWHGDIDAIRRHPKAAEIVASIGRVVKAGYRAIDRAADRQYLGTCFAEEDGAVCHAELWVKPGAHQVECGQCGTVHDVFERRAAMLEQAENVICTVKEASYLLGEIGHIKVTQASIRGYLHRKRIAYRPGGTMIRLGDLLAVVVDEGERKGAA